MADKNRISMPASTAGLTRYFEDYKSTLSIKPAYIIVISIAIILVLILLSAYGHTVLG